MKKLGIVGSRSLEGHPDLANLLDKLIAQHQPDLIITGDCPKGVDKYAKEAADRNFIQSKVHCITADWSKTKLTWEAHFKPRNQRLVADLSGPEDQLIVITDPKSTTRGGGWTGDHFDATYNPSGDTDRAMVEQSKTSTRVLLEWEPTQA